MLEHYGDRCLSIKSDNDKDTTFCVELRNSDPPDWNALQQTPTIHLIVIYGISRYVNQEDLIARLAQNIRQHGGIRTIDFMSCQIDDELVQLWDAMIGNQGDQETPVCSLIFYGCRIKRRAAETLQLLLQRDIIKELGFLKCDFDVSAGPIMEMALRNNQSLRGFGFNFHTYDEDVPVTVYTHIEKGFRGMLHINQNLVKLVWRFEYNDDGHDILWELSNRAANNIGALQSLEIVNSTIDLRMVQSIIRMGLLMHSFREISFVMCEIYPDALKAFIEALSRPYQTNPRFDKVKLELVTVIANDDINPPFTTSCERLQVQHLSLVHTNFDPDTLVRTMTELANNPSIQSLDLRGVLRDYNLNYYQTLCDVFLRSNRGPSKLILDLNQVVLDQSSIAMFVQVLQQNTSVKSLTIREISGPDLVTFAQGLAHMHGLYRLALGSIDVETLAERFCQALQQSLEHNNTLCKLSMTSIHVNARRYLPRIRYLLATNLVGRHVLMRTPNVPLGLWAHVLARSSKEADGIYFALTEMPDIILES
jgi:hypothetical protein